MKVKIKKGSKTKQYNLISKWSDVNLESWLKLIDAETGSKSKEALETITALSDIPKKLVNELSLRDVAVIMSKVAELQAEQDSKLKRIIELDGKTYGFIPDLDSITLGEYAEIETFIKNDIEKNLPELMAVLYRPITEKGANGVYTIAAYDGKISIRAEEFKKMSAEQVQSSLFFFYNFVKELLKILPSYLMEQITEINLQTNHLRTDGGGSV